jgi:hypothetical protein
MAKKVLVERNGNQIEIDAYWFSRSIVSIWKRFLIDTVPFVVGAVAENSTNLLPKDIIRTAIDSLFWS